MAETIDPAGRAPAAGARRPRARPGDVRRDVGRLSLRCDEHERRNPGDRRRTGRQSLRRDREVRRVPGDRLRRRCSPSRSTRWPTPGTRPCCCWAVDGPAGSPASIIRSGTGASGTSGRSWWRWCCSRSVRCSPSTRASRRSVIRTSSTRWDGPSASCCRDRRRGARRCARPCKESRPLKGEPQLAGVHPPSEGPRAARGPSRGPRRTPRSRHRPRRGRALAADR